MLFMSKKIQLTIAEPCHENWDGMTPVEKGKFCGSCQKQVVDFSNMSDRLVAEFFKKPSTGSVCGRFMTDQLDRDIEIPRKRIPWLKYFFQFALPAFFLSKASAQNIKMGKIANPHPKDTAKISVNQELRTLGMVLPTTIKPVCKDTTVKVKGNIRNIIVEDKKVINGKVINDQGIEIPGASVRIKDSRTGIAADENGEFQIKAISGDILVTSAAGFETIETPLSNQNSITILLKSSLRTTGEIIAGMVSVKKSKNESKNIPLLTPVVKDSAFKFFKIFPNPVSSGASLSIEWKKTEDGYYRVQLLNQSGQSAHQQEIWIDAEARILNIDIPLVAAGSYFMVLINKKTGKKFTEKIIIQ